MLRSLPRDRITRMMTSSPRKPWIFIDWDETITNRDTLSLIAPPDGSTGAPPFSWFGEQYMKMMDEFERNFGPRDTLERQLEFLDRLKIVEKESVGNVERRGLFRGVTKEDLYERAKKVEFRPGWKEFAENARKSENAKLVAILSVNWSSVFIEAALKNLHDEDLVKEIEIRANNLEMKNGKGTGMLTKSDSEGICTGPDKLREMKKGIEKDGISEDVITVYIGDSNTDLPCLLYADIGIIIGEGKSIVETCRRVGIQIDKGNRIDLNSVRKRTDVKERKLYHFQGWHEINKSGLME